MPEAILVADVMEEDERRRRCEETGKEATKVRKLKSEITNDWQEGRD